MSNNGKFINLENGRLKQNDAISSSVGIADANKIIKLNSQGKFDTSFLPIWSGYDNHSYFVVDSLREVQANQEMIVSTHFIVISEIKVYGKITVLNSLKKNNDDSIPNFIKPGEYFRNGEYFEKYFRVGLRVQGFLENNGNIVIGV